jgi:UDP-3-O-[3-hydroxymyristoyl] N-acetylglucosamine deacetylase/3-hydroxyacyl-[acyl-carrier-protein] dehydratase
LEKVKQVERATTLAEGSVKVSTVEHLLSALRGLEIDNALIELDANEPPIGDGSAAPFLELLAKAGRKELEAPRSVFQIKEPVWVTAPDGGYMAALPHEGFKVSCTNSNHTAHHTQFLSIEVGADNYAKEIGRARTFVFYEEVEPLLEKGLIKGGSLENAIVIRGESVMSKEPMRYPDEFVRLKILDIIGDLALFPLPIRGHILAAKPSHGLNLQFAKALLKAYRAYQSSLMPVENVPVGERALDINDVMKILPHRYPFLMVDRVLRFEGDTKAVGLKTVTINEPFFQGHFPQQPVMPGVLIIEAMAQAAAIFSFAEETGQKPKDQESVYYFVGIDGARFRKPVLPGDQLHIEVVAERLGSKICKYQGRAFVDGQEVAEAKLMCAIRPVE